MDLSRIIYNDDLTLMTSPPLQTFASLRFIEIYCYDPLSFIVFTILISYLILMIGMIGMIGMNVMNDQHGNC